MMKGDFFSNLTVLDEENRRDRSLFRYSLIVSLALHLILWAGFYVRNLKNGDDDHFKMEIDLTKPIRIGGNPLLKPGGGTAPKIAPEKIGVPPPPNPEAKEPSKPKDWILPGPNTKELEKPKDDAGASNTKSLVTEPGGTGEGYPGTGGGYGGGDGQGGGVPISRFPKLLNRAEILKLLRRNYPDAERQSGVEGDVIVDLHISAEGSVVSVEIVDSSVKSFDSVAQMVARKMRFSPALMEKTPIAVKIRQSIAFRLESE